MEAYRDKEYRIIIDNNAPIVDRYCWIFRKIGECLGTRRILDIGCKFITYFKIQLRRKI